MKTSEFLFIGDPHFTELPRDGYRWRLFKAVDSFMARNPVRDVVILGDLTTAKDRHSAQLVNRIADHIHALAQRAVVHIVRGNHDGLDPNWPYFAFLNHIPCTHFYRDVHEMFAHNDVLILPHSRNPSADWAKWNLRRYRMLIMHQTFKGAIGENESEIPAEPMPNSIKNFSGPIYSGDVHVPQRIGPITYVGAPHPIRYGDSFKPRMIYLPSYGGKPIAVALQTISRRMLDVRRPGAIEREGCKKGDQVKVRLHLHEHELQDWEKQRKEVTVICRRLGLELAQVEIVRERIERPTVKMRKHEAQHRRPKQVLSTYVASQKVPERVADVGASLLPER